MAFPKTTAMNSIETRTAAPSEITPAYARNAKAFGGRKPKRKQTPAASAFLKGLGRG